MFLTLERTRGEDAPPASPPPPHFLLLLFFTHCFKQDVSDKLNKQKSAIDWLPQLGAGGAGAEDVWVQPRPPPSRLTST